MSSRTGGHGWGLPGVSIGCGLLCLPGPRPQLTTLELYSRNPAQPVAHACIQLPCARCCRPCLQVVTGEIPQRGTMRNPKVPEECPQVSGWEGREGEGLTGQWQAMPELD